MKCRATAQAWFSVFPEKALVRRVKRCIAMRMVSFWRSTCLVPTCDIAGLPKSAFLMAPVHSAGLYLFSWPLVPVVSPCCLISIAYRKRVGNRFEVSPVPVSSQLDAGCQSVSEVEHDVARGRGGTVANCLVPSG